MNIVVYLLFLSISICAANIFGHIYFVEVVLYINIIFSLLLKGGNKGSNQIIPLDIFVVIFAVLNIVSVIVDLDNLYVAARVYRYTVLTPSLIYALVRYIPVSAKEFRNGLYILAGGTLIQSVNVIKYYILYGGRADNAKGVAVDAITLGLLICISLCHLIFTRKLFISKISKLLWISALILLFFTLIVGATRAAMLGIVIFLPLVITTWKNLKFRRLISKISIGFLFIFVIAILTVKPSVIRDTQLENTRKLGKSINRLYSPGLYLHDLKGRLELWSYVAKRALKRPILGSGLSSYGQGEIQLGSSHNFLVSSLLISGVPGLIMVFLLIGGTYQCLNKINPGSGIKDSLSRTVLISFQTLLLIGITNDLSGGRHFIFFFLMALAARLSLMGRVEVSNSNEDANKPMIVDSVK